jgi:tetratricopeptide (TPR) repeat protein
MRKMALVVCLGLIMLFVACDGNQPKPISENDKSFDSGQVKPATSTSGAPYGGDSSNPTGAKKVPDIEKPAALVELEKAYEKNPNDAETKKKLVQATYDLGRKIEYDDALPPFVKYPQALSLFTQALELDPTHKEALAEKEQIENIYRSMNKPIPQVKTSASTSATSDGDSSSSSSTQASPTGAKKVPDIEKPAALVELEKAYEKNPNDANTKKKLVQATYDLGRKIEYDDALPPFVKYPQALRLFRRTLELDAAHKEALAEKEQIENIYRSMNKPIPQ